MTAQQVTAQIESLALFARSRCRATTTFERNICRKIIEDAIEELSYNDIHVFLDDHDGIWTILRAEELV